MELCALDLAGEHVEHDCVGSSRDLDCVNNRQHWRTIDQYSVVAFAKCVHCARQTSAGQKISRICIHRDVTGRQNAQPREALWFNNRVVQGCGAHQNLTKPGSIVDFETPSKCRATKITTDNDGSKALLRQDLPESGHSSRLGLALPGARKRKDPRIIKGREVHARCEPLEAFGQRTMLQRERVTFVPARRRN